MDLSCPLGKGASLGSSDLRSSSSTPTWRPSVSVCPSSEVPAAGTTATICPASGSCPPRISAGEDLRSSAGTLALWHTPALSLGCKEGRFDGNCTIGETQSGAGCEVRGPDSFVVETLRTQTHAPYSSLIIVRVFKCNSFRVLLT